MGQAAVGENSAPVGWHPPRALIAIGILFIALLTFSFPGHTYLHQDTQIYVPMLERSWNPSLFAHDLSATRPHMAFTIYGDVAVVMRRATGASFEAILEGEQFVFRAAGVLGIYLAALALGLEPLGAMAVAGWCSLGAVITGPAVLAMEYEPTPRAFALGLVFLALGLALHERWLGASFAAGLAFVYHAPAALPFWILLAIWLVHLRKFRALAPLAGSVAVLLLNAWAQARALEPHPLFARLDPVLEQLQRMRASYNWVSLWGAPVVLQYFVLFALIGMSAYRWKPRHGLWFLAGLPVLGLASIPASYLLMDRLKWSLMAQVQPARTVLFITTIAVILCAISAVRSGLGGRWIESAAFFFPVFLIPQQNRLWGDPGVLREVAVAAALAIAAAALVRLKWPLLPAAFAMACFFLVPFLGNVKNYPSVRTPSLDGLSAFARANTTKDAVFLFPEAGKSLYPGMFRALSLRTVYADWKTGGQVNYFRELGIEWWKRWRETMQSGVADRNAGRYRALGIDYVVLRPGETLTGAAEVYRNSEFAVYAARRNESTSARDGTDD